MVSAPASEWPHAAGEMAALIRAYDWGATPLGPVEGWPQSLRTAVDLMLASAQPVYVAWGAELTSLYNDGYIAIAGAKHPAALGQPYRTMFAEVWDLFRPVVAAVMAGEPRYFEDAPLPLAGRPGRPMSWFTFSWTPLRDDDGRVGGFYCAAVETTDRVLSEQRLETRYEVLFNTIDEGFCIAERVPGEPPDFRYLSANPAFERQTGLSDPVGRTMRELVPTVAEAPLDLYARVAATGRSEALETYVPGMDQWFEAEATAMEQPGQIAVLFRDITPRKRAERALRDSEERQAFLLALGDAMRAQGGADAVIAVGTRLLGERLGASRIVFAEIDDVAGVAHIRPGWTASGALEHPAELRLDAFGGPLLDDLRAGRTVRFDDVGTPPFARDDLAALAAIGVRAWG